MAIKTSSKNQNDKPIRDILIFRSRVVFAVVAILAIAVLYKVSRIQFVEKKKWLAKVEKVQRQTRTIRAMRGNIYASDGKSLLATSVPKYRIGIDPRRAKQALFDAKIDSLCYLLSWTLKEKSPLEYKIEIVKARESGKVKFVSLSNKLISYEEKAKIKKFPLFREGAMKGGGKFEQLERRVMPFDDMALRTIGKLDRDTQTRGNFGIEASFNNYLAGKNGFGVFQRLPGGTWKPVDDSPEVRPEAGFDVIATVDVNIQDIVESALKKQVTSMGAKYGSAIVMEVATGEIKAITNLSRRVDSTTNTIKYIEDFNYAVRGGTDPGSTFKLATMVALLEKGNFGLNDFMATCEGSVMHRGTEMKCSEKHGNLTAKEVFEHSCNVGIYRMIQKYFGLSKLDEFVSYMHKFKLHEPVIGTQLKNETKPIIHNSKSETYSSTTFPWMSIGYESRMTPLQMLTFYNAIANKGFWVQPLLVKEIRQADQLIEKFEAAKDPTPICSDETIKKVWAMMAGVVENGTAKNIDTGNCKVAGKTGTSQKRESGYQQGKYYTAFIGFFPANNPKYSCAVIIDEPQGGNLYARDVAAPVFREIADKVFGYDVYMHMAVNKKINIKNLELHQKAGYAEDFRSVAEGFGLQNSPTQSGWVRNTSSGTATNWKKINENTEDVPNIQGLTLRDALPLLENKGFRVRYSGFGKIAEYALTEKKVVSLVLK
jgi:cell division protein FtsI (penicillin-binding protein 3)